MRRLTLLASGLIVALVGIGPVGTPQSFGSARVRWVIRDLGTLPAARHPELARSSWAVAINERGQVVGESSTVGNEWPHAFLWQSGNFRDLGALGRRQPRGPVGSARSWVTAINDRGSIVGYSDSSSSIHAFLWQDGRMLDLGTLGGKESRAVAINNLGEVVGWSETASRGQRHVFVWKSGRMRDLGPVTTDSRYADSGLLGAINDHRQIIWTSGHFGRSRSFLWEDGRRQQLRSLGGTDTNVAAINERGQVVGSSGSDTSWWHGVLWEGEKMTDLSTTDQGFTLAHAINDHGQVVVTNDRRGTEHAFLWQKGKIIGLGSLPGRKNTTAVAINDHGQIVGYGYGHDQRGLPHGFVWENGELTDLGTLPGGRGSVVEVINDGSHDLLNEHNQIVGYSTTTAGEQHAVLWTLQTGG